MIAAAAPWRTDCFGLALESCVPFAGCEWSPPTGALPVVRLDLDDPAAVQEAVPRDGAEVIARLQVAPGRWREHVRTAAGRGYVLTSPGRGVFHLDPGGERVLAAPARVSAWRWQRAVGGEVLPFAAALHGLETLHASGVALPDCERAIAVTGASGSGKTSVAANLVLGGCAFVADDVVAIRADGDRVLAYPGLPLMSVRRVTVDRLGGEAIQGLGALVGRDARGLRLATVVRPGAIRLAGLYILDPDRRARRPSLEHVRAPSAAMVLGATFNLALRTPARLLAQFEAAAALAAGVRVVRVVSPPACDHAEVAALILSDATEGR